METRENILQELGEIAPLIAGIQPVYLYNVPAGYFDSLAGEVLEKTRIDAALAGGTAGTFGVPEGYFEGLSSSILAKIKNGAGINEVRAELEEVAPLLNMIGREAIYMVPAGYFEQVDLTSIIQQKKEGKVVTLRIARKWMQYAAAAVMTGILVTGAFIFTNDRNNIVETENERIGVSSELGKVSEADLATYLDNPEHFVAAPAATSTAKEEELADVKSNIKNLSDEVLTQYLNENAEAFEPVVSEKE